MALQENQPEPMAAFFDVRAAGYDEHMQSNIFTPEQFTAFYSALAKPIPRGDAPYQILDLGCGTGLELPFLFERAPYAYILGIDLSDEMLTLLKIKFAERSDQLELVHGSYLTYPFGEAHFDFVLSAMTMHHFLEEQKLAFYRKIRRALKPGGLYIEGDTVVTPSLAAKLLDEHKHALSACSKEELYHLDIPFPLEVQKRLLYEVGFTSFRLLWEMDPEAEWNHVVYAVG